MTYRKSTRSHSNQLIANYYVLIQFGAGTKKWTSFKHNGVMFPPEYIKHNIPVIYNGVDIILDKDAEEAATLYAKYIESDYVKDKKFNKNFWNDWRKILGENHPIVNFNNVNFRKIYEYILDQKIKKKLDPIDMEKRSKIEEKYKTALVDGIPQPVGNFRIEPPGIFLGRGCNPNLGKIKRRIYPEDIIINIEKDAPVPDPIPGHIWKQVIHDNTVEWLASWKDIITGKTKYVWLGANSNMKSKSDMKKFDMARKLKKKIKSIRSVNNKNMLSDDMITKQISTALYFIDNFALRIGNEKGKNETDTVGVSSLRKEHIKLLDNDVVNLDFLGKDSVRYNRKLRVDPIVYKNLTLFMDGKSPSDKIFDLISSSDINKYLQQFMKNLTAKVFRTYNASSLFQKELKKISKKIDGMTGSDKINLLLDEYNRANGKVALLCNHQKNINNSSNKQLLKLNTQIKETRLKLKELRESDKKNPNKIKTQESKLKKLIAKKSIKTELKNIALGTSKINYIDPRITVAFIRKHNIPIEKLFSKTLQEKFKWALAIDDNYHF